jgi:hypothetical protein
VPHRTSLIKIAHFAKAGRSLKAERVCRSRTSRPDAQSDVMLGHGEQDTWIAPFSRCADPEPGRLGAGPASPVD